MSDPEDLIPRLKRFDESAVQEFALMFGQRLSRLFLRRGFPAADAEALAVSCVTDAVMSLHQFHPAGTGSLERWVFTMARNAAVDAWRRNQRTRPLAAEVTWPDQPDWDEPPSAVTKAVDDALAHLSDQDRTIVQMHHFNGWTFAEIGQQLQLQEGTVRVRHHRALKRLSEELENQSAVRAWREGAPVAGNEESP